VNSKKLLGTLVSAGTTVAMLTVVGVGVAHADPVPTGNRQIAMVGSDTTTPVMNALANDASALAIGGTRMVASFNATGSATIDTHGGTIPACTAVPRPDGSSAGRDAYLASLNANGGAGDGCIQGFRSSSNGSGTFSPSLTYVPYATEAISFAITNVSNFPKNIPLTGTSSIQGFFRCTAPNLVGGTVPYKVMLPQNGSGTRSYWTGSAVVDYAGAGITLPASGPVSGAACIENGADENGVTIQEHNGQQVNNSEIVPFSVAQWGSQASGVITSDVRGATRLGQVNSTNPFSDDFALQRTVFNGFATTLLNQSSPPPGSDAAVLQTLFAGAGSQLCSNASAIAIIKRFGLRVASNCGSLTFSVH